MNPVTGAVSKGAGGKRVSIDPISRLEGHGKIDIFLDARGDVEHAYLQIPELRGFEVFRFGRPVAEPGGICISKTAFDHIETKLPLGYEYLGEQTVTEYLRSQLGLIRF